MLLRFIVWIIIGYILAKIIGAVIQVIRKYFSSNRSSQSIHSQREKKQVYRDVQDVEYEEVEESKKNDHA